MGRQVTLSGAKWGDRGKNIAHVNRREYPLRWGRIVARLASAVDEAITRANGTEVPPPAQRLAMLARDGTVVLGGRVHGGVGRSTATIGGRSYSYAGARLTKALGTAVDKAFFANGVDPFVIGDLRADDAGDGG